jgi:hypothetical protein
VENRQDCLSPSQDLSLGPLKYEAGLLTFGASVLKSIKSGFIKKLSPLVSHLIKYGYFFDGRILQIVCVTGWSLMRIQTYVLSLP